MFEVDVQEVQLTDRLCGGDDEIGNLGPCWDVELLYQVFPAGPGPPLLLEEVVKYSASLWKNSVLKQKTSIEL